MMSEHDNMKSCFENVTEKNKKLQRSLDNVMNLAVEGVKHAAICDGIDFSLDDFHIKKITTIDENVEASRTRAR